MPNPVAFEFLFERLRQEGFRLGYDHQLRVQELLGRLSCKPEELGSLLAPVFATTPAQQRRFLEIFAEVFEVLDRPAESKSDTELPAVWKKLSRFVAIALVAAGAGVAFWRVQMEPAELALHAPAPPAVPDGVLPDERPSDPSTRERQYSIDLSGSGGAPTMRRHSLAKWLIVGAPWMILLGVYLFEMRRRKTVVERAEAFEPPHYWPLRVDPMGELVYAAGEIRALARLMRTRLDDGLMRLDIRATLRATIRSAGFPRFRFRPVQRPPEFLVLIERRSLEDHFACLITDLFRLLHAEGVYHTRYYFEGDPRGLVSESGQAVRLEELSARTAGHRVLVFGSSGNFLHPVTGRLEDWAAALWERWPMRAALLADAPGPRRLRRLREAGFVIASADTTGVRQTVEYFAAMANALEKPAPEFKPLSEPYGEDSPWLAACAVYQEVNWNLSLMLAPGKVDEVTAGRLARVEWLRAGLIPPPARDRLIDKLSDTDRPAILAKLRSLLHSQPPPAGSYAYASWQSTLRLFDGTVEPGEVQPDGAPRDITFLRFLKQGEASNLTFSSQRRGQPAWFSSGINVAAALSMFLLPAVKPFDSVPGGVRITVADAQGRPVPGVRVRTGNAFLDLASPASFGDKSLVVYTPYPLWTESWSLDQENLRILVGTGRPKTREFLLDRWDSELNSPGPNTDTRITVDFAGPATSAQLGDGPAARTTKFPIPPETDWVRETADGVAFYVRPVKTTVYRWGIVGERVGRDGKPYAVPEFHATTVAAGEDRVAPPILSLTASPPRVANPGTAVTLSWNVGASSSAFYLRERGGRNLTQTQRSPGRGSLVVYPAKTTTYDLVAGPQTRSVTVPLSNQGKSLIEAFNVSTTALDSGRWKATAAWKVAVGRAEIRLQSEPVQKSQGYVPADPSENLPQSGSREFTITESTRFTLTVRPSAGAGEQGEPEVKSFTATVAGQPAGYQLALASLECPAGSTQQGPPPARPNLKPFTLTVNNNLAATIEPADCNTRKGSGVLLGQFAARQPVTVAIQPDTAAYPPQLKITEKDFPAASGKAAFTVEVQVLAGVVQPLRYRFVFELRSLAARPPTAK
ncbi:MAG TPA: hypothetical protein VL285_12505 [Bryobacteraceae bacterium]|nr:hypothetical protein [Bryobacteraceae bacterium]